MRISISIALILLMVSCGRKNTPQIQYIDHTTTHYDTIDNVVYVSMDSLFSNTPCDSFVKIVREKDTVFVREIKRVSQKVTVVRVDTVYRTPIVTSNVKINNKGGQIGENTSLKNKKGDNINGDGNTIKKAKSNWWWIFLAGMLSWAVIQNVLWKIVKRYLVLPI